MKFQRYFGTLMLAAASATMLALGSAQAQTAADIDRLWCIRMRESLVRNFQAVERMRAEREAGIRRLRAEHQVQANRNLQAWYWKKVEELFQQRRALEAECRAIERRPDGLATDRVTPLPRRQPLKANRPNRQETLRYPPYERYPERNDPFTANLQR